jgi:hypothetical protein
MPKWLPWLVAAIVVVFIAYEFAPAIWNVLATVGGWVVSLVIAVAGWVVSLVITVVGWVVGLVIAVVGWIVSLVIAVVVWISNLFVAGFALVGTFVTAIVAALIVGVALAVALGIVALLVIEGTRLLSHRVVAMTAEMHALKMEFREGARDAAFIAILSLISGVIFFMMTEDFAKDFSGKVSTIRFLAASSVGYCVAKLFLLFPTRVSKIGGVALTCLIVVGSAIVLNARYDLVHGAVGAFPNVRSALAKEEPLSWMIGGTVCLFAALSLLYPFTLKEWKRMLSIPPPHF